MALIKCSECGKEFSDKATACPNCACPVDSMTKEKKEKLKQEEKVTNKVEKFSKKKFIIIAIVVIFILLIGFVATGLIFDFFSSDPYDNQSNLRDEYIPQVEITAEYINIRASKDVNSEILGKVYLGEIYTIISEDEESSYNWYKIATENYITGYIAGQNGGQSYVDELYVKDDKLVITLFHGDLESDPYSNNLINYLNSLDSDLLSKIYIKKYNIWSEHAGRELMEEYEDLFSIDDETSGTPFVIVNDKYALGFSEAKESLYLDLIKSELGNSEEETEKPNNNSTGSASSNNSSSSNSSINNNSNSSNNNSNIGSNVNNNTGSNTTNDAGSSNNSGSDNNTSNNNNNTNNNNNNNVVEEVPKQVSITSMTGVGTVYTYKGTSCTLDSFNYTASRPYTSSPDTVQLQFNYKATMTDNLRGWDYCKYEIKVYDSTGVLVHTKPFSIKVGLNEQGYDTNSTIFDSDDSNFSMKILAD